MWIAWIILSFLSLYCNTFFHSFDAVAKAAEPPQNHVLKPGKTSANEGDIDIFREILSWSDSGAQDFGAIRSNPEEIQKETEFEIGSAAFTTYFSSSHDKLTGDGPSVYQTTGFQAQIPLDYTKLTLPGSFSFSYAYSFSQSSFVWPTLKQDISKEHLVTGSLCYSQGDLFDATVSFSYAFDEDILYQSDDAAVFSDEITASFWPIQNLSITPTLCYSECRYIEYELPSKLLSCTLSMTYYGLFEMVDLSLSGSYSQTPGSGGPQDEDFVTTALWMSFDVQPFFLEDMDLSFEMSYENCKDNLYPEYSYKGFSSTLTLEFPF